MLVLTRRPGQSIIIGNEIVITITEVMGDKVRIGIDAPKSLTVLRQELLSAVEEENTRAATVNVDLKALLRELHKE